MATPVNLVKITQSESGTAEQHKLGYVGFSWTTFFFGPFVPLFRKDFLWFIILLILIFIPFANLVMAFIYNKIYTQKLVKKGFQPADKTSENFMLSAGINTVSAASVISDRVTSR